MNKIKSGILLSMLLVLVFCSSCQEQRSTNKLLLNEVLLDNESNLQDDYGVHSAWIEIFNRSFGSTDISAHGIEVQSGNNAPVKYFIPKGDVETMIKPRQHTLFWADGEPRRGTFHTNFVLNPNENSIIRLYDSGGKLLDEVEIPAGALKANQSWARVSDGADTWEVKDGSEDKYVTPSTNNLTNDSNSKVENFERQDPSGVGMAISAMTVVFSGLLLLFIIFKIIGTLSVSMSRRNAMRAKGITDHKEAAEKKLGQAPGEVFAAIAMAMHEMQNDVHDMEDTVLTITPVKRKYSPWSSKIYTLRENPHKK